MKTTPLLLLLVASLFVSGCSKPSNTGSTPPTQQPASPILRIAVLRDGSVTADGVPTTIESLTPKLKALAASKGSVYYYREAGQEEPHPNAMKVISAIGDNRLPVSLSSKPDFSDYIGEDGQSHKR